MGLFHRGRKNRKEETDESVKTNANALQDSADGAEAEEKTESEKKGEVSLSAEELEKKAQQVNLGRMNRLEGSPPAKEAISKIRRPERKDL